ncbi:MAG: hypothetical protein OXD43_12045 [Bacteroidetes bacterium]|nr:hypothetical protein [Bacteroidota bacterium]
MLFYLRVKLGTDSGLRRFAFGFPQASFYNPLDDFFGPSSPFHSALEVRNFPIPVFGRFFFGDMDY